MQLHPVHVPAVVAATALPWAYFAAVDPTVGAAAIAACGSIITVLLNALLIRRHESHVDARLDERRLVVTHAEDAVTVTDEERRLLEDRRLESKNRKVRDRRRQDRRK